MRLQDFKIDQARSERIDFPRVYMQEAGKRARPYVLTGASASRLQEYHTLAVRQAPTTQRPAGLLPALETSPTQWLFLRPFTDRPTWPTHIICLCLFPQSLRSRVFVSESGKGKERYSISNNQIKYLNELTNSCEN